MYLAEKPRGRFLQQQRIATPQHRQMILGESSSDNHEESHCLPAGDRWALQYLQVQQAPLGADLDQNAGERYDRSPTMCTNKWRNLLKEFKKAKHQSKGSGSPKMLNYKELDELLKERSKKGLEDANTLFGSVEGRQTKHYTDSWINQSSSTSLRSDMTNLGAVSVVDKMDQHGWTVGDLWSMLVEYSD
ncbi:trihelix transcription factor GT-1-like isoform X1 [Canna indica]|uniref:Trihelix transcription factor GT-1-like isoform X1 n=1 Tax=Canna indica TaxID=4628 RepID=A0AAQ3KAF4_9LILI|nr:trihelix transcription factor GT-1-like isoform X1 [Canna indica]